MRVMEAIGQSEAFLAFTERLSRAAAVDRPVLLIGERGTGKELAAAKLHYLSRRWEGPLVALNCAALSAALLEAELFGHEAGAFTGATKDRPGRFEAADGGTLLLDEAGLLPLEAQEKILRIVEYGTFERVGSSRSRRVDTRIVAATNADLPALARAGRFKEDLLDRLSFEVLHLPPLRARAGDVAVLAGHFAARMARELALGEAPRFADGALAALEAHAWPGNIRELKNLVHRLLIQGGSEEIALDEIEREIASVAPADEPLVKQDLLSLPLREAREHFERAYLTQQLQLCGGWSARTCTASSIPSASSSRNAVNLR